MGKFTRGNKVRIEEKALQQYLESSDIAVIEGTQAELFPASDYKNRDAVYRILVLNKINQAFARYQWVDEVHLSLIDDTNNSGNILLIEEYEVALKKQGKTGVNLDGW